MDRYEMIDHLQRANAADRIEMRERQERRAMGFEPPEWVLPPRQETPTQQPRQSAMTDTMIARLVDAKIKLALDQFSREAAQEVAAAIVTRENQTLNRFAADAGKAIAEYGAKLKAEIEAMIDAKIEAERARASVTELPRRGAA